jgi:hypothetical protein
VRVPNLLKQGLCHGVLIVGWEKLVHCAATLFRLSLR